MIMTSIIARKDELRSDLQRTLVVAPIGVSTGAIAEACLIQMSPKGPNLGRKYNIQTKPLRIGRDDTCEIQNLDSSVSRFHAEVKRNDEGQLLIRDLGSTNGTFVNNVRVDTERVLQDGDSLQLGNCLYRFLSGNNLEAEYHEEIHRLMVLDPLTGLHNRRSLQEFLDRELERANRDKLDLAVLMLDIDHFKSINDRYGHLLGDYALRTLANILKPMIRGYDMLARFGGEEYILVLPGVDLTKAQRCAERILRAIREQDFEYEGVSFHLTVSIGVASWNTTDEPTESALLSTVDRRLYRAKQMGRNQCCVDG